MNKKGVGITLLALGIVSYLIRESIHYIGATLLSFKFSGISNTTIKSNLSLIPPPFSMTVPTILVIFGIFYLVWSELERK
ncbi:hypothetical protein PAECIP111892_05466 [Paenibacillus auburnensis]|uniref:Uncharacterized protein n=1 Tax=Paenibacillus auburnensis TaxID=2905649 RepID=A0ABM9CVX9_9BACL|nr:hypothetical protein PAECIP111892_05466 [Paenibacillus auburnensis]